MKHFLLLGILLLLSTFVGNVVDNSTQKYNGEIHAPIINTTNTLVQSNINAAKCLVDLPSKYVRLTKHEFKINNPKALTIARTKSFEVRSDILKTKFSFPS